MHVLMIPSWYPADISDVAGSFFREQAEALLAKGIQVGVLAATERSPWGPKGSFRRSSTIENGVPVLRFSTPHPFPMVLSPNAVAARGALREAFKSYASRWGKPDILHAHSLFPGAYYADFLADEYDLPFVYTEHRSLRHLSAGPVALRNQQAVARRATLLTAVSGGQGDYLKDRFGDGVGTWRITPNLLPPDVEFSRAALRSPGEGFTVGHLSNLDPVKEVPSLIRAFASAFRGVPDVKLRIGGGGSDLCALRELTAGLDVEDQVDFLGELSRSEVPQFCAGLDVFALPSSSESFGVTLTEAMGMGTPVISTATWGGNDVVTPADGKLVDIGDEQQLVAALREARAAPSSVADRCARRSRTIARFGREAFAARAHTNYTAALANYTAALANYGAALDNYGAALERRTDED